MAADLGVPVAGIRLSDGSGLARSDLIPSRAIATLLAKVAGSQRSELRAMFAGLPIGGFTGTLAPRFLDVATRSGAGVVRAKTGTLAGVNALAGVVVDADGRLLAFAFMASHPTPRRLPRSRSSTGRPRSWPAAAAATLPSCQHHDSTALS